MSNLSLGTREHTEDPKGATSYCADLSPEDWDAQSRMWLLGLEQLCLRSPRLKDIGVERVPSCSCFCVQGATAGLLPIFSELLWHFLKTMHD